MDVKEYRRRYEAELAQRSAGAADQARDAPSAGNDIPSLLATLRDARQTAAARLKALLALMAARFLGPRFAPYNAEFLATLRAIARPDTDPELREQALEVL